MSASRSLQHIRALGGHLCNNSRKEPFHYCCPWPTDEMGYSCDLSCCTFKDTTSINICMKKWCGQLRLALQPQRFARCAYIFNWLLHFSESRAHATAHRASMCTTNLDLRFLKPLRIQSPKYKAYTAICHIHDTEALARYISSSQALFSMTGSIYTEQ